MRFEETPQLDYSEVLLKPKRSTLSSRKDVVLERTYNLPHSSKTLTGIPIMAANMDTVATVEAANVLTSMKLYTAMNKHYSLEEYVDFFIKNTGNDLVFYAMGTSQSEIDRYNHLSDAIGYKPNACIDVANGYSEAFIDRCAQFRDSNPDTVLMAGNICTPEITEELILKGVDIVKVGIGGGCFVTGSIVHTKKGNKPIEIINIGDLVKTHTNKWRKVTNKFKYTDKKNIIKINDIEATPNHEFYVVHKIFKDIVSDDNIHYYAEWISASNLTADYFLISS